MSRSSEHRAQQRVKWRGALMLAVAMLLGGCGTPSASSPTPSGITLVNPGTGPRAFATGTTQPASASSPTAADPALLATLRQTERLTIIDSWWVYGPVKQVTMRFTLQRTADRFSGSGSYHAESYYGPTTDMTRQIDIPQAAMEAFFATLAAAPRREGAYSPKVTHSDYSPDLRIELVGATGAIIFHSQSQGETHVPWAAQIGKRSFVIDSPEPMIALDSLEPFLRRAETIKALTASIDATLTARPTEPPFVPVICRTPVAGQPPVTPFAAPSADPQATRVARGTPPQVGATINVAEYFGLAGSSFVSVGGNLAPRSITDRQQIDAIIAALDRAAPLIEQPAAARGADILITIDVGGKPISLSYITTLELISFSVDGRSYAFPAPPGFRALWAGIVCSR